MFDVVVCLCGVSFVLFGFVVGDDLVFGIGLWLIVDV